MFNSSVVQLYLTTTPRQSVIIYDASHSILNVFLYADFFFVYSLKLRLLLDANLIL